MKVVIILLLLFLIPNVADAGLIDRVLAGETQDLGLSDSSLLAFDDIPSFLRNISPLIALGVFLIGSLGVLFSGKPSIFYYIGILLLSVFAGVVFYFLPSFLG